MILAFCGLTDFVIKDGLGVGCFCYGWLHQKANFLIVGLGELEFGVQEGRNLESGRVGIWVWEGRFFGASGVGIWVQEGRNFGSGRVGILGLGGLRGGQFRVSVLCV